ncbi:DNA-binding response regulator [Veronia nyctiphanis]|uniref:DNA-binding response regulator n=1 Tax=Veronia nyctiphanis TaxID=1278244 RepID=A0A4Q0YL08_9GAMM|nr:LytTR family DNA-binding domain-containing protein [Veronia nyctiphanis]RXJ71055.1 DNA-binding response regulator [Veronia nyctiphanis]
MEVLIVDDERLARAELKRLLNQVNPDAITYEARHAHEALEMLEQRAFDLVFLDISMPEMTGLEMAEKIQHSQPFVFCTAYDAHAVEAFTLNAVDYLLKPVQRDRLRATLDKFESAKRQEGESFSDVSSSSYLSDSHGLMLKVGEQMQIVRLGEVERFESVGNHVAIYHGKQKFYLHASLSRVEGKLDPDFFFKASRSQIIRLDQIDRIENGIATGSLIAVMNSGAEVEISRRQAQTMKQQFAVF